MLMRLSFLLLALVIVFTGGPTVLAQDGAAQQAADALRPHLQAPSRLAATAILIHQRTGRFPQTAAELLGHSEAIATGIRRVRLAELGLSMDADTLHMRYVLTPTREEPSERSGAVAVSVSAGEYDTLFRLAHHEDPDFSEEDRPVASNSSLRVRRARGSFCVDSAYLRTSARDGSLDARFPFLDPARPLVVRFWNTRSGTPEGEALLSPRSD